MRALPCVPSHQLGLFSQFQSMGNSNAVVCVQHVSGFPFPLWDGDDGAVASHTAPLLLHVESSETTLLYLYTMSATPYVPIMSCSLSLGPP